MEIASLCEVLTELESKAPRLIVELGAGFSTVLLAAYARAHQVQLVSVESSPEYLGDTLDLLEQASVSGPHVSLVAAGMKAYSINGTEFSWYDVDALNLTDGSVEFLLVDGPPGSLQKRSRYPAMPLLWNKLASGAQIFLDDADRPDEMEICRDWIEEFSGDLSLKQTSRGRRLARFEKGKGS